LLGAYLNFYITQSAPQSITWLSIADAKRLGIEVSPLGSAVRVPDAPAQTPARTPPASPAAMPPPLWQVP